MNSEFGRYMADLLPPPFQAQIGQTVDYWLGSMPLREFVSSIIGEGGEGAETFLVFLCGQLSRLPAHLTLFDEIGALLDALKAAIFAMRRSWVLPVAPPGALAPHGAARGLGRAPGEADESYRTRLLAAADYYRRLGTRPGMEAALRAVLPDVEFSLCEEQREGLQLDVSMLDESFLTGEEARGFFTITFSRTLDAAEQAVVTAVIEAAKPAHTYYRLVFPEEITDWLLGVSCLDETTLG